MPRLPESFLQELRYRCDIESIVSSYVQLKRRGRTLLGLCPFHSEKTPLTCTPRRSPTTASAAAPGGM